MQMASALSPTLPWTEQMTYRLSDNLFRNNATVNDAIFPLVTSVVFKGISGELGKLSSIICMKFEYFILLQLSA